MFKSLSRLLMLLSLIVATSSHSLCQNTNTTNPTKTIVSNQPKPVTASTKKGIRNLLFKQYYKMCLKEVVTYGGGGLRLKVDSSEGVINLYYVDGDNQGWGPGYQIHSIKDFIEGDLNNDGYNDLVVCVPYNQGTRPRLNIHCYITVNKQLKFFKMYTANELGICNNVVTDTSGRFFPSKIENGFLMGQTDCLQSGDPGCCPSLEMISYFKFNKGLQFAKQERKKGKED